MILSTLQRQIVTAPEPKIVVVASAAAGKTACMTERVRWWLKNGVEPSDICCITFTNMAATEMKARLADDYKDGLFIGTIHSLAAHFLSAGGLGAQVGKLAKEEKFDKFFELLQQNQNLIKHYKYVCSDETQDISYSEYKFIFEMINPENFFAAGDPKQCIYEQLRGASPQYMAILSARDDVTTYNLNENFRNKINILNYAKSIIRRTGLPDDSICKNPGGVIYEGSYDLDQLCDWIERTDNYADWAILTYTNIESNFIREELKKELIPTVSFKQSELTKAQLEKHMKENKVKVLTVWSAKGLEFKNVAVYGHNWVKNEDERDRVKYVAATRAKNTLLWLKPVRKSRKY